MQGNIILVLLFALFIAIFSIQNIYPVSLAFFNWSFETSLVVVVLGGIVLGAIIMGLFASFNQLKLKRKLRTIKKEKEDLLEEKRKLEEEINLLKMEKEPEEEFFENINEDINEDINEHFDNKIMGEDK